MRSAFNIFENDAFRKRYEFPGNRRPINKALFESWSVGLARRSDQEIGFLVHNREKVIHEFKSLMNEDREFETAISYSTGTPSRVKKRFRAIEELIEGCF